MERAIVKSYENSVKCAIVVTYNHIPDLETLKIISRSVQFLLIIDNNSNQEVLSKIRSFSNSIDNVHLIENKTNLGISKAYNLAKEKAMKLNGEILIFFDHDVILNESLFFEYKLAWDYFVKKDKNLGIIVPIVTDDKRLLGKPMFTNEKYSIILSPINSGILTSLNVYNLVGGYEPDIFVELADYYFAYKVRNAGKNIYRINRALIIQEFEVKLKNRGLLSQLADYTIRLRSVIRLGLNNSNIYRTTLSVYNSRRSDELKNSLSNLEKKHPDIRQVLRTIRMLNALESLVIYIINKLDAHN